MTSYHEDDHSSVDFTFGVRMHVHQPRFLEWVGVPESTRLLSRPSAEWLQVMNRRDTLHAALQLQRDGSLMSSNLTVMHQYVIALHKMSTEVFHSMFGREFFPSGAVNDAVRVPHVPRALGNSQLIRVVPIWIPYTRARIARVVPCVVRGRPVGSWSRPNQTASLHRFIPGLDPLEF